jgi:RHS repeat-associated protein
MDADYGFTGFYLNRTTGLDLPMYRAYDHEIGRWLSRDPLQAGSLFSRGLDDGNLYRYVENDPILLTDAFGLESGKNDYWHPPMPWPPKPPTPPPPPWYSPPGKYSGYWSGSCMWVKSVDHVFKVYDFCHLDCQGNPSIFEMPVAGNGPQ